MKEIRPQFVRMKARFEEEPPPRDVCCLNYRHCLAEAAYKNYCLDCSLCPEAEASDSQPSAGVPTRPHRVSKSPPCHGLPV
jgi:hypothetical protein